MIKRIVPAIQYLFTGKTTMEFKNLYATPLIAISTYQRVKALILENKLKEAIDCLDFHIQDTKEAFPKLTISNNNVQE